MSATEYIGRFAPTPSGPLHFGSIVAAVGSWLDAKAAGGIWKLRIDDLDPPRVAPGCIDSILRSLEGHGLHWDGQPHYQANHFERYQEMLEYLTLSGHVYLCNCSRKDWQHSAIYPGTCRSLQRSVGRAYRFKCADGTIAWEDRSCGTTQIDLSTEVGDFLLKNAHGIFSYPLANAIDDCDMGITDVVRGADLLTITAAHIKLQQTLGAKAIRYRHLPLALTSDGEKISKATHAPAAAVEDAPETLKRAFHHLGLGVIPLDNVRHMLDEAVAKWSVGR